MNFVIDEWSLSSFFTDPDVIGVAPSVVFFAEVSGGLIHRLDPATDIVTDWTLPFLFERVDDIKFVRDYVFIAEPGFSRIVQLNPTTSRFTAWTAPFGPETLASDSQGNVYFVGKLSGGISAIGRLNDSTKEFKVWAIPTGLAPLNTLADGLSVDSSGNIFFTVWGSLGFSPIPKHGIGRLNPRTNTFTGWETPNMPLGDLGINSTGLVYFLEQDIGLVGPFRMARLNPNSNTLTEWIYSGLPPLSSLTVNPLGGVYFPIIASSAISRFDPQRSSSRAIRRHNFGRVLPVTTAARGVIGNAASATTRAVKTSQTIQATTAGSFTWIPFHSPGRPAHVVSNTSGQVFFTELGASIIGRLR